MHTCTSVREYNSVTPYSVHPVLRRTWDIRSMRLKLITVISVVVYVVYSINDIFSLLFVYVHKAPVNLGAAHVGLGTAHSQDA